MGRFYHQNQSKGLFGVLDCLWIVERNYASWTVRPLGISVPPAMVCAKCEKKLGKVITPDPWKSGARNNTEGGGRKIGENKALTSAKNRYNPTTTAFRMCRICRTKVHQPGSHYCQACAYKKGICAMCGIKLLSIKNYKQSSVWLDTPSGDDNVNWCFRLL